MMCQRPRRFARERLESRLLLASNLSVAYDTAPTSVRATEELTYLVRIKNNGPDDAENALVEFSETDLDHASWTRDGPYPFPANVDLAMLDGKNGFAFDRAAEKMVTGDLNGDAIDDLIIGESGSAYVIFGHADVGRHGSISKYHLDGTNGFTIDGLVEYYSVDGEIPSIDLFWLFEDVDVLGDINGDGIDDLRIDGFLILGNTDIGNSGSIDVRDLGGTTGFMMNTPSTYSEIRPAGDFNGDGFADWIVPDSYYPHSRVLPNWGAVWIEFGGPTGTGGRFLIEPSSREEIRFGEQAIGTGDVNNDGYDDILVTDAGLDDEMPQAHYLIYGGESNRGKLTVSQADSDHPRVDRFVFDDRLASVSESNPAMDWNGDGYDDVLIRDALIFGGPQGIVDHSEFDDSKYINFDELVEKNGVRVAPTTHSITDLNGDGTLDRVLITRAGNQQVRIEFSVDIEDLASVREFGTDSNDVRFTPRGRFRRVLSDGDINGDEIQDLVITDLDTEQTYVVFGTRSFRSGIGRTESVSIPAGEEIQIEIRGFASDNQSKTISNSVVITLEDGQDPNLANNSAISTKTTVLPAELPSVVDLSAQLFLNDDELAPSDLVSYTLHVANNGTSFAKDVALSVDFANLLSPTWIREDGQVGDGPINTRISLFAGQTHTYTIHAKVGRELFASVDASVTPGEGQEFEQFGAISMNQTTAVPLRTQFPTLIGNVSICYDDTYAIGKDLYFVGWPSWDDSICFQTRAMASSGFYGGDLWKTDGTVQGTHVVKHIRPQQPFNPGLHTFATSEFGWPEKLEFAEYKGLLFFAADDGEHGSELWRTDGTEAGTYLVKDINPTVQAGDFGDHNQPSNISNLQVVGDVLAFKATDGTGVSTWISDGTANGTTKVEDLTLRPTELPQRDYLVANEDGQFLRADSDGANSIVIAEREIYARNVHAWSNKVIFNNVAPRIYDGGHDPLFVLDTDVDSVDIVAPEPFQSELATNLTKSFATEVIAFEWNPPDISWPFYREEAILDNPFEFLGDTQGSIYFQGAGEFASITVGFPGLVVDGPGNDIEIKLDHRVDNDKQSIAVFGIRTDGGEELLASIVPDAEFRGNIDLAANDAKGPFSALRFEATENSRRLFSVEATIAAATIFTATAPNNLDYEFSWDLNADGVYGDRIGRSVGLTTNELESYGIAEQGQHPLAVRMNDRVNNFFDETTFVVLEAPASETLVGDINADGAVSFADFLVISANFGRENANREQGDLDGDRRVAFNDFILLQQNFGRKTGMG